LGAEREPSLLRSRCGVVWRRRGGREGREGCKGMEFLIHPVRVHTPQHCGVLWPFRFRLGGSANGVRLTVSLPAPPLSGDKSVGMNKMMTCRKRRRFRVRAFPSSCQHRTGTAPLKAAATSTDFLIRHGSLPAGKSSFPRVRRRRNETKQTLHLAWDSQSGNGC
jgi:hypothetical protein